MALTREQAEALAPIFVAELKKNAKELLDVMPDGDRAEMHPQAFAVLEQLSNIQGKFCEIWPPVDKSINELGWLARMVLGGNYALVKTLQAIGEQIAAQLCGAKSGQSVAQ